MGNVKFFTRKTIVAVPLFFVLLCVGFVVGAIILGVGTETMWRPENGVWYCEKLQMQLSFDEENPCYAVIDGEKSLCYWENDRGSEYLSVACMQSGLKNYVPGDTVFSGKYVDLDDEKYILKDCDTGETCVFIRIG